jgi:acetyltransferase
MKDEDKNIKLLFEPRSIAIVGASKDKSKIGHAILKNIISGGYKGKIYPVNPAGEEIEGIKAYRNILEIDDSIDVACIAIPAKFVFDVVKQCAEKSVKYGIIITSGFSEIGNTAEEKNIVTYANNHGMRVLGPNVFGIYSANANLNATFVSGNIPSGEMAMITQSGALGLAMLGLATFENIGLSAIVSVGNKSDVDEADLLEYLVNHENTKIILIYIEGIRDGAKFARALKKATRKKPVVIIKSGRSQKGAIAAASHTGSLAGSDEVIDAIIRQCGALRAESTRPAFDWSKYLARAPLPRGENTVIITNGGGAGVMATDACEKFDVKLYDDTAELKKIFSNATPAFGSTKNPIDITGQATAPDYTKAFEVALSNKNIHAVLAVYCETALFNTEKLDEAVEKNYLKFKAADKPILFALFGGEETARYAMSARRKRIPVYDDVYEAVSSLSAMFTHQRYMTEPEEKIADINIDSLSIDRIVLNAANQNRYFLLSSEAQNIVKIADIRTPSTLYAANIESAVKSADTIGYPVAMKIVSKDIIHKSDVGGVALHLDNAAEVIDAFGAIMRNCRTRFPNAAIEGVEISEMAKSGIEMIVGARKDKTFGPIVMIGLGGIYVEVMKDISFRVLPLDRKEILSMIKEIRSYPLLLGIRGEKMADIESLVETVVKLGSIIQQCKGISDIEINPLIVYEQGMGTKAVDTRILLSKGQSEVR